MPVFITILELAVTYLHQRYFSATKALTCRTPLVTRRFCCSGARQQQVKMLQTAIWGVLWITKILSSMSFIGPGFWLFHIFKAIYVWFHVMDIFSQWSAAIPGEWHLSPEGGWDVEQELGQRKWVGRAGSPAGLQIYDCLEHPGEPEWGKIWSWLLHWFALIWYWWQISVIDSREL